MTTTVTSDGRVTLPKPVCDRLGIGPGSEVDFEIAADGRVVLIKAQVDTRERRFARLRGSATTGLSTDEIMALTRGEDARDPG